MPALIGYAIGLQEEGGASASSGSSSSSSGPSLPGADFDHTYVQSIEGHRWGCYGRKEGGRRICSGGGRHRIRTAKCHSEPGGRAGIIWGVTGTCHQCANRILNPAGVTVSRARGYAATCLQFGGAYGEPSSWLVLRGSCYFQREGFTITEAEEVDTAVTDLTDAERHYNEQIIELYRSASVTDPQVAGKDLELLVNLFCGREIPQSKMSNLQNLQLNLRSQHHDLVQSRYGNEVTFEQFSENSDKLLEVALQGFEKEIGEDRFISMFKASPSCASRLMRADPHGWRHSGDSLQITDEN